MSNKASIIAAIANTIISATTYAGWYYLVPAEHTVSAQLLSLLCGIVLVSCVINTTIIFVVWMIK